MVQRMLKPAVNLESLAIIRMQGADEMQCLDISQAQLATYPRLAVLSLRNVIWEDAQSVKGNRHAPSLGGLYCAPQKDVEKARAA